MNEPIKSVEEDKADVVGMVISILCAIHCVATPFVVYSLPYLAYSFHHPLFHLGIAVLVVPVGLWAFYRGYRQHHNWLVIVLGLVGLLTVTAAAILPHQYIHLLGHTQWTLLGSAFLISAHWLNRKKIHQACSCHKH